MIHGLPPRAGAAGGSLLRGAAGFCVPGDAKMADMED